MVHLCVVVVAAVAVAVVAVIAAANCAPKYEYIILYTLCLLRLANYPCFHSHIAPVTD